MSNDTLAEQSVTHPIEYQVFALSFREEGAIKYFRDNLEPEIVGLNENQQGIANYMAELQDLYGKKSWFIRSILKRDRE